MGTRELSRIWASPQKSGKKNRLGTWLSGSVKGSPACRIVIVLLALSALSLSSWAQTLQGTISVNPSQVAQGYPNDGVATDFQLNVFVDTGFGGTPEVVQWFNGVSWQTMPPNGTPSSNFASVLAPKTLTSSLGDKQIRVCRASLSICSMQDPNSVISVVRPQVLYVSWPEITQGSSDQIVYLTYISTREDAIAINNPNGPNYPKVFLRDPQGNETELTVSYFSADEGNPFIRYVDVTVPASALTQVTSYKYRIEEAYPSGPTPLSTDTSVAQEGTAVVAPAQFTNTSPLPPAQVGVPYNTEIIATGGVPYDLEGPLAYNYYQDSGTLPSGLFLSGSFSLTGQLSGTSNDTPGIYTFTFAVSDRFNVVTLKTFRMGLQTPAPNLSFSSSSLNQGRVAEFYFSSLAATGGVPGYTFYLPEGGRPLPGGLELQPDGSVIGVPTSQGTFTVDFLVEDTQLRQATIAIPITILPPYPPVVLTSTSPLPNGRAENAYSFQFQTIGGAPPYFYYTGESGNPPPGLTLSSGGLLSGTPTTPGTYEFGVGVYDSRSLVTFNQISDFRIYRLTIDEAVPPPTFITPPILSTAEVGTPYSATLQAKDGVAPLVFIVPLGTLPAGLEINPNTGTISGTPTTVSTVQFLATVRDSRNQESSQLFTIDVVDQIGPLSITTNSPLSSGALGDPYSTSIAVTGGLAPYLFSVSAGSLPPGLSLNPQTGGITGTPTLAGDFVFTVAVTDASEQSTSKEFTLRVVSTVRFTTQSPLPDGLVGEPYTVTIGAERGTMPYQFSVIDGQLPGGVTLNPATGVISGTPTAPFNGVFTVRVRDAATPPADATRVFQLRILQPLELTVLQLPAGTVNAPYSLQFGAQGGVPSYSFAVVEGSLPAGITLTPSGLLAGTATAPSTQTIVVRVTDSQQSTAQRSYTLEIRPVIVNGGSLSLSTSVGVSNAQNEVDVTISEAEANVITGVVTLTVNSTLTPPVDDPSIQFVTGGRTVAFTIPPGQTSANFGQAETARFQTGTTAATIVFTAAFQRNGEDVTPNPAPQASLGIPITPPTLTDLGVTRGTSNLTVVIRGFAPERNISTAVLEFTRRAGAPGNNPERFDVNVTQAFQQWFGSAESQQFGSQFRLTIPVTLSGDPADIIGVTVRLTGPSGTGNSLNATF